MNSQTTNNYQIRNLHSYIKKDNLDAFIELLKKRPSLLDFKNFKNENILFYSLLSNSKKISSYLMIKKPSLLLERNNLGRNPAQNIASKKIDLEIDGRQHKYKERKESDKKRDIFLTSKNWIVYRVEWNEINTNKGKELMKQKIDDFLKFYNML